MEKEFVPYELAVKLKELGFNEPCFATYSNVQEAEIEKGSLSYYEGLFLPISSEMFCLAPTYQQAFRWFREKGIENEIHSDFDRMLGYNRGYIPVVQFIEFYNNGDCYETYEEAELACIEKMIEIVESNLNK
jgi:hypothetical protein